MANFLEAFFKQKKPTVGTVSTLDEDQQGIMSSLAAYLQGQVGKGVAGYTGETTAKMSEGESAALAKAIANLSGGLSSTALASTDAYKKALTGLSEKEVYDQYMKYTAPSENAYLKNTLLPTFKESQVPGGTLRSSGTERGIAEVINNFGNQQLSRIGQNIQSERANAILALGQAGSIDALEKQTGDISTAAGMGGIARAIEQQELTSKLQEFIRTQPEANPLIEKMLALLGVTTTGLYTTEGSPSAFMQILNAAGGAAGEAAAMGM